MSKRKRRVPPAVSEAVAVIRELLADIDEGLRIINRLAEMLDDANVELRRLRWAQRNLTRVCLRYAAKNVKRHRKRVDPIGDEQLRHLHDECGKSYAWLARREGKSREAIRQAVYRARQPR